MADESTLHGHIRNWLQVCIDALETDIDPIWLIAQMHLSTEHMINEAVKQGLVAVVLTDDRPGRLN